MQDTSIPERKEKIAVIIPMYRVEPFIQNVIRELPAWVDVIIAVDDASPDQSADRAAELNDPRVTILRHEQNRGVGGAMVSGFQRALELGASVVVKMDGDGQMSPRHLQPLLKPILSGEADFAKGNRFATSQNITLMPFIRRAGNLALSFIVKGSSGYWNTFDPTNGYFAVDAAMLQELDMKRLHPRYYFECSLLGELGRHRAVIADVPMPSQYGSEQSSLSVLQTLLEFPPLLILDWFTRIRSQYFTLDFSVGSLFLLTGSLLAAFGSIWGIAWWLHSIRTGIVTTTGTVMLAVLPLILGVQLLIQFLAMDIQTVPKTPRNARSQTPTTPR